MEEKLDSLVKKALTLSANEEYSQAIDLFKKILNEKNGKNDKIFKPDFINKIREQICYCYLAIGDLNNAWKLYSYRESGRIYKDFLKENSQLPLWDGTQDLSENNLLLLAEEGIGDEILYSSFFHLLNGSNKGIFIECDKRIRPLYNRSYHGIIFFDRNQSDLDLFIGRADFIGLIGDVTRYLNPTLELSNRHYLVPDVPKTFHFKQILKEKYPNKTFVGVSYNSKGTHGEYRTPPKDFWDEIFVIQDDYVFVNLQENDQTRIDKRSFLYDSPHLKHFDSIDLYNDIDTLTSLINAMDFVISINNYVSHLAGRIGKLSVILMGKMANCRMLIKNPDNRSLWYPNSIVIKNKTWKENEKELIKLLSGNN